MFRKNQWFAAQHSPRGFGCATSDYPSGGLEAQAPYVGFGASCWLSKQTSPQVSFFLRQSFILELWVWEKSVLRTTPPNLECGGLNLHPQGRTCAAHRNRDRSWRALQHRSILFFFLPPGATPRSRRRRTERSQCRRTATSGCARGLGAKVVRNARCGCDACIRGFPA